MQWTRNATTALWTRVFVDYFIPEVDRRLAESGLLTPPLGISCYVIKSTLQDDRITLHDIFAGAFPFADIMLLVLIVLIAFPQLSLILV